MKTKNMLLTASALFAALINSGQAADKSADQEQQISQTVFENTFCLEGGTPVRSKIELLTKAPIPSADMQVISEAVAQKSVEITRLFKFMAENHGNDKSVRIASADLTEILQNVFKTAKAGIKSHFEAETAFSFGRMKGAKCRKVPVMLASKTGELRAGTL